MAEPRIIHAQKFLQRVSKCKFTAIDTVKPHWTIMNRSRIGILVFFPEIDARFAMYKILCAGICGRQDPQNNEFRRPSYGDTYLFQARGPWCVERGCLSRDRDEHEWPVKVGQCGIQLKSERWSPPAFSSSLFASKGWSGRFRRPVTLIKVAERWDAIELQFALH